MMKLAVTVLTFLVALSPNQAKTTAEATFRVSHKHLAYTSRMPTKNVRALAAPRHQKKFLATNLLIDDEDDGPAGPDELDLQSPYRRPRVATVAEPEDDTLSDHVTIRLAVARARAMAAYREKFAQNTLT
jgi:hypothetical protein